MLGADAVVTGLGSVYRVLKQAGLVPAVNVGALLKGTGFEGWHRHRNTSASTSREVGLIK